MMTNEGKGRQLNEYPATMEPDRKDQKRRYTPKKITSICTVAVVVVLALPTKAHAGVFGVFDAIFSTVQDDMGASLKTIDQVTRDMQDLYQKAIWPLPMINQARGFVAGSIAQYRSYMTQVFQLPSKSATLANPQQLEAVLHSRQTGNLPTLQASFAANYGSIPQVNAASPQDRVMMDIDDALGQENLKTTVIADQGEDVLLATADQMENQAAVASPGSAPFITAQAQVANLRSQATMQKMLASELRQEAGRIAHDGVLVKRKATAASDIQNIISGTLAR